jgi:aromatic ring-opening dioxygenase LigB subunit
MLLKNLEKLSSKDKLSLRLDKLANLYNKTRNDKYKLEWNKIINLYFYKKKSSNM